MTHLGVSVIVVANKYDTWRDTDAVVRKTLARTLRCHCHAHGAALLFAGGLSAALPPPAKDAPEYKALLAALKTMLAHFAFSGPDRKLCAPPPPAPPPPRKPILNFRWRWLLWVLGWGGLVG